MPPIKAILFDFGGTLDNDGVDWFTRLHRAIESLGPPMDRNLFQTLADNAAYWLNTCPDVHQLSFQGTAERICQHVHRHAPEPNGNGSPNWTPKQVADLFHAEADQFLTRNRALLAQLRPHYQLGCISNNWGNTAGWCRQFELDQHFQTIIDSTVVGITKPEPGIFRAALDQLNLPPQACAYVGDWFPADIVGAHAADLKTIWVAPPSKTCPDPTIVDHRITTLPQLTTLDLS